MKHTNDENKKCTYSYFYTDVLIELINCSESTSICEVDKHGKTFLHYLFNNYTLFKKIIQLLIYDNALILMKDGCYF